MINSFHLSPQRIRQGDKQLQQKTRNTEENKGVGVCFCELDAARPLVRVLWGGAEGLCTSPEGGSWFSAPLASLLLSTEMV